MPLSPRDRRILLILGPVLVILIGVFLLLLTRSKGTPSTTPVVTPSATASPAPSVSPSPSPTQILVFSGRDPFSPIVGSPAVSSSPGGSTSPGGGGGGSVSPSVSPAGSPGGGGGGGGGGGSTTVGSHTVVLDDIFTSGGVQKVQVEVDGTVFTVSEGQSFDDNFKLVSINGSCADFLFGDQSFTLCTTPQK
jgi:hypothetical protein